MPHGRLFGAVELPPVDPRLWDSNPNYVYGCTLCYQLKHGPEPLLTLPNDVGVDDVVLTPVEFKYVLQSNHGPTLYTKQLSDQPVSICVSMGHIYWRELADIINDHEYRALPKVESITILDHDLPYGALVYADGVFYNRSAAVLTTTSLQTSPPTSVALVGLNAMNQRLRQWLDHPLYYQHERQRFIHDLDDIITTKLITNDTSFGLRATRLIVENSQLFNTCLPLQPTTTTGSYGVMFQGRINAEKLIYKYLDGRASPSVVNNELAIVRVINDNLQHRPDLPYPYTYSYGLCGAFDYRLLTSPTCPPMYPHGADVVALVQEYLDHVGTLKDVINKFDPNTALNLLVEAIATLAEAHQGNTVQHHFMHLDAHGGNFLVSTCDNTKTCRHRNTRTTDLGGLTYKFGLHGYKVYLIDFGFSYVIGSGAQSSLNGDVAWTVDRLMPALDLVTLLRSTLPKLARRVLHEHSRRQRTTSASTWKRCKKLITLTAVTLVEHTMRLTREARLRNRLSVDPIDEINCLDADSVAQFLSSLDDVNVARRAVLTLLARLYDVVYDVIDDVTDNIIDDVIDDVEYVLEMLCGIYYYEDAEKPNVERVARTIEQRDVPKLPDAIKRELGINQVEPVNLRGLARFLWYYNAMTSDDMVS